MEVVQCLEEICSRAQGGFPPPKLTSLVPKLLPLQIAYHGWVYQWIIYLIYVLIVPSHLMIFLTKFEINWRSLESVVSIYLELKFGEFEKIRKIIKKGHYTMLLNPETKLSTMYPIKVHFLDLASIFVLFSLSIWKNYL